MRKFIGFLIFLILLLSFTFAESLPLTKVKIMPPHERLIEKKIKLPTLPDITPISIPKGEKIYGIIEKTTGVGSAIVIPVEFIDKPKRNDIPSNYFEILFNSIKANWSTINPYNLGSVRDFLKENSYDQFDINATVLSWYTAQNTYTYYINDNNYGFNGGVFELVREVLQHAVDSGYDLRNYDVVFVIHSGQGAEWTGDKNDIWSHASTVYVNIGGQNVPIRYSIEPEYMEDFDAQNNSFIIPQTVGVFVHEMGHSFGHLPDLYDRDYSSLGLGRWSLMAGGSWNGPQGPSGYTLGGGPSHFDAWCKIQLDWINPIVPKDNLTNVIIPPVETNPVVYKLWTDGVEGPQYFLIENRQKIGFDSYLRGAGLLIYHVDENVKTQNDNEWYPGLDPSKHYLVALEQANGLWQLEKRLSSGNAGHPYPGSTNNTTFDENSTPNSNAYGEIPTGVAVRNITVSGENITCDIYVKSPSVPLTPSFIHHIGWSNKNPLTIRPLFKWTSVPYAIEYNLQVATDSNFNNLVIDITTQDTEYRPPLSNYLSLGTTYYMRVRAGNANGYSDWSSQESFTTPTSLEALIVADDGGEFGIAPYIENAFVDLGIGYNIIDVFKDNTVPSANYMLNYDWVLWAGDWGAIYYSSVQNQIINYLNNGGKLFITSQDLGWGYSAGYISETFYKGYLKANFVQDSTEIYSIKGVNGTTFEGLTFNLNTVNSAQNQEYPDEIDPLEGAQAILVYNPTETSPSKPEIKLPEKIKEQKAPSIVNKAIASSGTAGLRYVDPVKNYSVVYFSFGFEGVDININEILLSKVRILLLDIQPPTLTLTVSASFNPNTQNCNINGTISDNLGYSYLTIKVYDTINGQKNILVKTITNNEKVNNGNFNYTWDGKDESGALLPNGKYIIEAIAKDEAGNSSSQDTTTILNSGQSLSFVNVTKFTKSFNPKEGPAKIFFNITQDAKVKFIVYNLAGEKVYEKDLGFLTTGNYEITWEGINWKGIILPNGLYLFQLVATSSQGEARINRFIGILK